MGRELACAYLSPEPAPCERQGKDLFLGGGQGIVRHAPGQPLLHHLRACLLRERDRRERSERGLLSGPLQPEAGRD